MEICGRSLTRASWVEVFLPDRIQIDRFSSWVQTRFTWRPGRPAEPLLCWFRATSSIRSEWTFTGVTLTSGLCVYSELTRGRMQTQTRGATGPPLLCLLLSQTRRSLFVLLFVFETSRSTFPLVHHDSYTTQVCLSFCTTASLTLIFWRLTFTLATVTTCLTQTLN